MLTVEGTYKDGLVVLSEQPVDMPESRVLITFIRPDHIELASRGIDREQAADLRNRLSTIADDWNRPEMDIYDVD